MRVLTGAIVALNVILSPFAFGQLAPISANVHQANQDLVNGTVTVTHSREGVFYRAPDGSTVTRYRDEKGQLEEWASLWDAKTGTAYQLDLHNRKAHTNPATPPASQPLTPEFMAKMDQSLKKFPEDKVEGISCKLRPVTYQGQNAQILKNTGTSCWSTMYDVELKYDIKVPKSSNTIERHLYQLNDMRIGVQLPADLFDLRTFTVVAGEN